MLYQLSYTPKRPATNSTRPANSRPGPRTGRPGLMPEQKAPGKGAYPPRIRTRTLALWPFASTTVRS